MDALKLIYSGANFIKRQFGLASLTTQPYLANKLKVTNPQSNYSLPIDRSPSRIQGYGRNWGQADSNNQLRVINTILNKSQDLGPEHQANLLAIARFESGYNPDAAAISTSASGVFQIVNKTADGLGLKRESMFDADANITAGIKLYKENLNLVNSRYPNLQGDQRTVMLYALHHDGPSLGYGGAELARKNLIPMMPEIREIVY